MDEYAIYGYVRERCARNGVPALASESHIISLVGRMGLDILKEAKLIETQRVIDGCPYYAFCCEEES